MFMFTPKKFYIFYLDFRVLIAGGGTGMNTLYIAEQLNHTNVS